MNDSDSVATRRENHLSIKDISDRVSIVHQLLDKVLKKGTHYGTVPGCGSRAVLLKPGADVLAMTFKLVPQFEVTATNMPDGHREYDVKCTMYAQDGTMLGQGVGSCSTMEKKYRYRRSEDGKKIENEDIADVYNTVLKMAKKRAHIDATLTVTGAGDLFTQDLIEDEDEPKKEPVKMPTAKATLKAQATPAALATVSGIIEDVIEIHSKPDAPKAWVKWGIKVGSETFGTFDKAVGDAANALKGRTVALSWRIDGKYKTAVEVVAEDADPVPADEGNAEPLPY